MIVFAFAMSSNQQQVSRNLARRGLLYTATIILVQLPVFLVRLIGFITGYPNLGLAAIAGSTNPLSGLLNLLVFMINRRKMRTAHGRIWRRLLNVNSCYRPKDEGPPPVLGPDLFATTVVNEGTQNKSESVRSL